MEEQFVSYDIAKVLKERGFNEPCLKMSEHRKECINQKEGPCTLPNVHCAYPDCTIDKSIEPIGLPLLQQTIEWFAKQNIFISIEPVLEKENLFFGKIYFKGRILECSQLYRSWRACAINAIIIALNPPIVIDINEEVLGFISQKPKK